jgi:hypothetical protein
MIIDRRSSFIRIIIGPGWSSPRIITGEDHHRAIVLARRSSSPLIVIGR